MNQISGHNSFTQQVFGEDSRQQFDRCYPEQPRVFDAQAVRFGCTCSEDRVRQSLSIYSAKDIGTMTTDDGIVTADCQFCGAHYELDPASVGFEAGQDGDA